MGADTEAAEVVARNSVKLQADGRHLASRAQFAGFAAP
jgi:hypothetical protein